MQQLKGRANFRMKLARLLNLGILERETFDIANGAVKLELPPHHLTSTYVKTVFAGFATPRFSRYSAQGAIPNG